MVLSEADFRLTDHFAFVFPYFDVCLIVADDLLVEAESVAKIGFCLVCNLEAADALLLEALAREEVEYVFDVLDAIDVAVDVNIAIVGIDGADELRLVETEAAVTFDGADIFLLRHDVSQDVSVV